MDGSVREPAVGRRRPVIIDDESGRFGWPPHDVGQRLVSWRQEPQDDSCSFFQKRIINRSYGDSYGVLTGGDRYGISNGEIIDAIGGSATDGVVYCQVVVGRGTAHDKCRSVRAG